VAPGQRVPVIATSQVGNMPYEVGPGAQILDLLGLADSLTAHLQLSDHGQFTGHEKPLLTPWVQTLLTYPGSSTTQIGTLQTSRPSSYNALIPPVTDRALSVQTAWALAALAILLCPRIHAVQYGPCQRLTVSSFLWNMVNSFLQATIRIPPDPETAHHRFCVPGAPAPVIRAFASPSGT
jgi:hypothetical protein